MKKTVLVPGETSGHVNAEGDVVQYVVDYKCTWRIGEEPSTVFDHRESFVFYQSQVCSELRQCVAGMLKGESSRFNFDPSEHSFHSLFYAQPVPSGASVTIDVHLLDIKHHTVQPEIDSMSGTDPVHEAEQLKQLGNEEFANHRYVDAYNLYKRALRCLQHVKVTSSDRNEQELQRSEILQRVWIPCQLNAAATELQLCKFSKAVTRCSIVLETDPTNKKALYRRAQGLKELGSLDDSRDDVQRLLQLDPDNKTAKRLLSNIKAEKQQELQNEKSFASSMFST